MLLNMRSRNTNYHAAINALVFWDQQVPKRLIEAFNHIGLCSSYPYQVRAVNALSKDVRLRGARDARPERRPPLPFLAGDQTLMTGFPIWDVMRVWR